MGRYKWLVGSLTLWAMFFSCPQAFEVKFRFTDISNVEVAPDTVTIVASAFVQASGNNRSVRVASEQFVSEPEVLLSFSGLLGDFNNDKQVGFSDFLAFAKFFGKDVPWWSKYSLSGSGFVNFLDFLYFIPSFGYDDLDIPSELATSFLVYTVVSGVVDTIEVQQTLTSSTQQINLQVETNDTFSYRLNFAIVDSLVRVFNTGDTIQVVEGDSLHLVGYVSIFRNGELSGEPLIVDVEIDSTAVTPGAIGTFLITGTHDSLATFVYLEVASQDSIPPVVIMSVDSDSQIVHIVARDSLVLNTFGDSVAVQFSVGDSMFIDNVFATLDTTFTFLYSVGDSVAILLSAQDKALNSSTLVDTMVVGDIEAPRIHAVLTVDTTRVDSAKTANPDSIGIVEVGSWEISRGGDKLRFSEIRFTDNSEKSPTASIRLISNQEYQLLRPQRISGRSELTVRNSHLHGGENMFILSAIDGAGNSKSDTILVYLPDTSGPTVRKVSENWGGNENRDLSLRLEFIDLAGIGLYTISGSGSSHKGNGNGETTVQSDFSTDFSRVGSSTAREVSVEVVDMQGHVTKTTVIVTQPESTSPTTPPDPPNDSPSPLDNVSFSPSSITTISVGQSTIFSVSGNHIAHYEWDLDGIRVSTSSSYTYTPGAGDSGSHTVVGRIYNSNRSSTASDTWNFGVITGGAP
jgi:hypothetical protein